MKAILIIGVLLVIFGAIAFMIINLWPDQVSAADNTTIGMSFSENISIGDISVTAGDSFTQSIRESMNDALRDFLNGALGKIISLGFSLVAIVLLSIWAFKSRYPVAFQLLFAVSLVSGFRWYDSLGTTDALAISLALIAYSFCMAGTALYTMLSAPKEME